MCLAISPAFEGALHKRRADVPLAASSVDFAFSASSPYGDHMQWVSDYTLVTCRSGKAHIDN